jgi:SP family sugar:H+ symporter-like MFS transporter
MDDVTGTLLKSRAAATPLGRKLGVGAICVASCIVGGFSNGVTIGAIGQVQNSPNWGVRHPSTESARDALLMAMMQVGAIGGAIGAGVVADRFGRKASCVLAGFLQAIGGAVCLVDFCIPAAARSGGAAWATDVPFVCYYFGRLVGGVGVGAACHSVPMLVAELSPERLRGPFDSAFQLFVCAGIVVSFVANLCALSLGADLASWWGTRGFLLPLGLPALSGAAMCVIVQTVVPESPKWLLARAQPDAARAALGRVRWGGGAAADAEFEHMRSVERRAASASAGESAGWCDLCSVGYRRVVALAFAVCWLQVFIGIDILTTYNVPVFVSLGWAPSTANLTTVVVGAVMLVAVVPSLALVEILGRRTLLIGGSVLNAAAIGGASAVAYAVRATCPGFPGAVSNATTYGVVDAWCPGNTRVPALKWVGLFCCVAWVVAFSLSWGPVAWVVPSETLPAAVRSKALTLCVLGNWVADYIVVVSFPALMRAAQPFGAMLVYAAICLGALAFVVVGVPETRGIEMADMEETHARSPGMAEHRRRQRARRGDTAAESADVPDAARSVVAPFDVVE